MEASKIKIIILQTVEVTPSYLKKINSRINLEPKLILTTETLFKFFLFSSFSSMLVSILQ
jgi:hypothetical protein